jgi:hypothetical protein
MTAQLAFDLAPFDAHGHAHCPEWARLWKEHYQPADRATLDNLRTVFTKPCNQCLIDASPELQAAVARIGHETVLTYSVGPHLSEPGKWAVFEHHDDPTCSDPDRRGYYGPVHATREAAEAQAMRCRTRGVDRLTEALVRAARAFHSSSEVA